MIPSSKNYLSEIPAQVLYTTKILNITDKFRGKKDG